MARAVNGVSAAEPTRKSRNNPTDVARNAKLAALRRAYRKLAAATDTDAERAAHDELQELIAQIPSRTRTAEALALQKEVCAAAVNEYRYCWPKNVLSPELIILDVAERMIRCARDLAKAQGVR